MYFEDFADLIAAEEHGQAFPHEPAIPMHIQNSNGHLAGTHAFDREHWRRRQGKRCRVLKEHVECVSSWGEVEFRYPDRKAA
jgi:hypothetical protein